MKRHRDGTPEIRLYTRHGVTRPRVWLPRREQWYYLTDHRVRYALHWRPWYGLWQVAEIILGLGDVERRIRTPRPSERGMKKLKIDSATGVVPIGVTNTSVMWGKLAKLREHLTATAYDDGTIRDPGYMWIKTTLTQWVITIFEPSACARLDVRGPTLDDTLLLVEKLLSAEEAPWEIDSYLQDKAAKKVKKKRA